MTAPTCPTSRNQVRGPASELTPRAKLPAIPTATDLPSLIRTVNIMRDVLRQITINTTINNVWPGPSPKLGRGKSYPTWFLQHIEHSIGFVFNKTRTTDGGQRVTNTDKEQRVYIARTDRVEFYDGNEGTSDKQNRFIWQYKKNLDSPFGDPVRTSPFQEDFFERIVNVRWKDYLAVEFCDGAGP
jgi:hypothetical protein